MNEFFLDLHAAKYTFPEAKMQPFLKKKLKRTGIFREA